MNSLDPILLNLSYAALGGLMLIIFNWLGARLFSNVMGFKIRDELKAGNVAMLPLCRSMGPRLQALLRPL